MGFLKAESMRSAHLISLSLSLLFALVKSVDATPHFPLQGGVFLFTGRLQKSHPECNEGSLLNVYSLIFGAVRRAERNLAGNRQVKKHNQRTLRCRRL